MIDFFSAYFNSDNALTNILWPIFIGILLGIATSICQNIFVGSFVKKLFSEEIDTPEKAKTLAELGFSRSLFVKFALRRGSTLRRMVLLVQAENGTSPETQAEEQGDISQPVTKITQEQGVFDGDADIHGNAETTESAEETTSEPTTDTERANEAANRQLAADFTKDKWYLSPIQRDRAAVLYTRRGASPLVLTVGVAVLFGLLLLAFYLIPQIADWAESIF